jgi:hypothetical protein
VWGDLIIDGRCRLFACALAGVDPEIEQREFASDEKAVSYIVSVNLMRAHYSTGQQAAIVANWDSVASVAPSKAMEDR